MIHQMRLSVVVVALGTFPIFCKTHEQLHVHANKAKTEVRDSCRKHYKTRYAPVKRGPKNGQHPERDQNEIGTRYKFASFEAIEGQDRVAAQDATGTPQKTRYTPENKIGMNFGSTCLPPLMFSSGIIP